MKIPVSTCPAGHRLQPFPACAYILREDLEELVGDQVDAVEADLGLPVRADEVVTFYWCPTCRVHRRVVSKIPRLQRPR